MDHVLEHLPVFCLCLEQSLEVLLLFHAQVNEGLMLALLDACKGLYDLSDGQGLHDGSSFSRS